MHSVGLAKKIWINLGILLLAYLSSLLFGFIIGRQTEARLQNMSDCSFPAAGLSQLTLVAFNEQVKQYEEGLLLGEKELINSAQRTGMVVQKNLQDLRALKSINTLQRDRIKELIEMHNKYTAVAGEIYPKMLYFELFREDSNVNALITASKNLALQSQSLQNKMAYLKETFAADLQKEISGIRQVSRNQRYFNMAVFFIVVGLLGFVVMKVNERTIELEATNIRLQEEIKERSRTQRALRESEERFRRLAENAKDMIIRVQLPDFKYDYISPAAKDLFGYDTEEIRSAKLFITNNIVHPDYREYMRENWRRILQGEVIPIFEYKIVHKSGQERWMHQRNVFILDEERHPVALEAIVTDLTELKTVQEELTAHRNRLEEMVKERTRALEEAQKELVQQEKMATLGKLTSTVSHEIRNPLGTVRTAIFSINDAVERMDSERIKRAVKISERNIIRCDNIISDLLDFTRTKDLMLTDTDLGGWINEILEEFVLPNDVEFSKDLDNNIKIKVDRDRLHRAVINILTNALQAFSPESTGKRLLIAVKKTARRLEIQIKDNGVGIAEKDMIKIFEPLYSTKSFGLGLGLSIVKQIMEQHQGGIEIQSELNKGTMVILWLPAMS